MTTTELQETLKSRGVTIFLEAGELRYRGPKGSLTDALRATIRRHEPELLERLRVDDLFTLCERALTVLDSMVRMGSGIPLKLEGEVRLLRRELLALVGEGSPPSGPTPQGLREALAALAHQQWSDWMTYLFSKCEEYQESGMGVHIPPLSANRWMRQMNTAYADLSEEEKESDRSEADRMIATFNESIRKEAAFILRRNPDETAPER